MARLMTSIDFSSCGNWRGGGRLVLLLLRDRTQTKEEGKSAIAVLWGRQLKTHLAARCSWGEEIPEPTGGPRTQQQSLEASLMMGQVMMMPHLLVRSCKMIGSYINSVRLSLQRDPPSLYVFFSCVLFSEILFRMIPTRPVPSAGCWVDGCDGWHWKGRGHSPAHWCIPH